MPGCVECRERRSNHDINGTRLNEIGQLTNVGGCFSRCLVHLPVGNNQSSTHKSSRPLSMGSNGMRCGRWSVSEKHQKEFQNNTQCSTGCSKRLPARPQRAKRRDVPSVVR